MSYLIRRLEAEDVEAYRDIRLESLNFNPEAYGSSYSLEHNMPVELLASRLKRSIIFGGFQGDALQGIVGYFTMNPPKLRHKGVLFGLYVRPDVRRNGLGRALVERVLAYAREKAVEQVQLTVVLESEAARSLYDSLGFKTYGTEPHAIKSAERYYDEELRVHFLNGRAEG